MDTIRGIAVNKDQNGTKTLLARGNDDGKWFGELFPASALPGKGRVSHEDEIYEDVAVEYHLDIAPTQERLDELVGRINGEFKGRHNPNLNNSEIVNQLVSELCDDA